MNTQYKNIFNVGNLYLYGNLLFTVVITTFFPFYDLKNHGKHGGDTFSAVNTTFSENTNV